MLCMDTKLTLDLAWFVALARTCVTYEADACVTYEAHEKLTI